MPAEPTARTWVVPTSAAGSRLDRHLADVLEVSRNRVQTWIAEQRVHCDERPAQASRVLTGGEAMRVELPPTDPPAVLVAEAGEIDLLHEDASVLAIAKPAGLVVHPGAGRSTGTLVHRLLHHYPEIARVGHPLRPGIVHRLDRDTTGVLLIARDDTAYQALTRAFAARRVGKLYLGIVWGGLEEIEREVSAPIGRHPVRRKEMSVRRGGRPARSHVRGVARGGPVSLAAIRLETGRTHQIRVHLRHLQHPLVGDPVYGAARWRGLPGAQQRLLRTFPRPALHAWRISWEDPRSGELRRVGAPPPADWIELWSRVTGSDLPATLDSLPWPPAGTASIDDQSRSDSGR